MVCHSDVCSTAVTHILFHKQCITVIQTSQDGTMSGTFRALRNGKVF